MSRAGEERIRGTSPSVGQTPHRLNSSVGQVTRGEWDDSLSELFGATLGRGTKGLGTGDTKSQDGSTVTADACMREYRTQALDYWLENKERQLQMEAREKAAEAGGGVRYSRKPVPHDWGMLRKNKRNLNFKEQDRKRITLREKLEERREQIHERLKKERDAEVALLKKQEAQYKSEVSHDMEERDGFRRWEERRRERIVEQNKRQKQRAFDVRRRQMKMERSGFAADKEQAAAQKLVVQAGVRDRLRRHREAKARAVSQLGQGKVESVRQMHQRQDKEEDDKKARESRYADSLRNRLQAERKDRKDRLEREEEARKTQIEKEAEKLRDKRKELLVIMREKQERDRAMRQEQYLEGSFSPEVLDKARKRVGMGKDAWRKIGWEERASVCRDERDKLRSASPQSSRSPCSPARSAATGARTLRPMSAPPMLPTSSSDF